ncbi:MAG TPA: 6-carboxytetrahydropterin synthase QueD [Planctomycetota bacterium]|nr:6-carboxytetrahydropterin synthase QueD [Planctomycetota bacterium]
MYLLTYRTDFAAAHQLRGYRGKCENLHGHNFKVEVTVKGTELDRCGMLVDFMDLKAAVNGCLETLDHRNLNDLPYFATTVNPSAENVARYVYEEVAKALPKVATVEQVTVYETDRCSATYRLS